MHEFFHRMDFRFIFTPFSSVCFCRLDVNKEIYLYYLTIIHGIYYQIMHSKRNIYQKKEEENSPNQQNELYEMREWQKPHVKIK